MRQIVAQKGVKAVLGKQGENNATQVLFPVISGLTGALIVTRDGDEQPYPVVTTIDGSYIVWTVNNYDTNVPGNVKAEVDYTDTYGTIVKSETFHFVVHHSLDTPSEEVPDPYDDWYQKVLSAKTAAETAETNAEASETAASASATAAAASETAASASEATAASSAETASTAATTATNAKTAAVNAQSAAETAASKAASSQTAAASSASSASTSATNSATSEKNAASSATAAASSAKSIADSAAQIAQNKTDIAAINAELEYPTLDEAKTYLEVS